MKLIGLFALMGCLCAPAAWAQCTGVQTGGQCLPPPCAPGSPLACPNGQQASQAPAVAYSYGAFAVDASFGGYWVTGYSTPESADRAAFGVCQQGGGQGCRSLGPFGGTCVTYAVDSGGQLYTGEHRNDNSATQHAMSSCSKDSTSGKCHLISLAVCAGSQYAGHSNEKAKNTAYADLEAISAKLDKRQYWGAVAVNDTTGGYAFDRRSKAEAEQQALANCSNCTVLATFENSCVGVAFPNDKNKAAISFDEVAMDVEPAVAKQKSMAQCTQKYGECKLWFLRCSGRRYAKNNFDDLDAPPKSSPVLTNPYAKPNGK